MGEGLNLIRERPLPVILIFSLDSPLPEMSQNNVYMAV